MPEINSKREERMKAVIKAATTTKESAIRFLIMAGILDPSGELAPHLRWKIPYIPIGLISS